jgi:hypothetical protein
MGAGGLVLLATLVIALWPATVSAASPSVAPSPGPSDRPPKRPPIEVWLDRDLPAAAEPGSSVDIGATVWDALGNEIPRMGATLFLRAVPPGDGEATEAVAIRDWPGHYRGTVEVPADGLDHIDLGVTGTVCENDACRRDDWVFPVAGIGPPAGAPITSLAAARIDLGAAAFRAGEPAEIGVVVEPNADWATPPILTEVVVRAREPRGPNVATATLPLVDAAVRRYAGSITIPRAGPLVLEAATDADGGDATRFGTSMAPITVEPGSGGGGGDAGTPVEPGAASDEGLPPIIAIVLAVAAVVGVGVMVAGFRSGAR